MIIKNTPVPTAEPGRKPQQTAAGQNGDHFASELKKQMSSDKTPQAHKAEEKSKVAQEIKKEPADEKTQHEEAELVATPLPAQADPLAMLADSSPLPVQVTTVDSLLQQDGQIQQPATSPAVMGALQALMPTAAPAGATLPQTQTQEAQSDITLAAANSASATLPDQAAAVLTQAQKPQAPAVNHAAPESVSPQGEKPQVSPDVTLAQTRPELPEEMGAKPASFGENMAAAMHNINHSESLSTPSLAHGAPITPASIATTAPAMPTLPAAGVATGTLQAEVGTPAWQQSLGQHIAVFSRNGIHHAELRLHPEDLGALQVSLKMNNDQAQVHFVAESHHVRAALESAMPQLRTMLAESGIQLGQSSVGADTASSSGSAFSGEFSGQGNNGQEGAESGVLAEDERIIQPVVMKYSSGINTFV